MSDTYYALLSNLFQQITLAPELMPVIQPERWPTSSQEQQLLKDIQAALTAIEAYNQERQLQMAASCREQATLEERQRLAQNLHDAVNQSLFSASLIAEVLPRLWERNPDEGRQSLEDLRRLTRGAIAEMRGLLVELQPMVITDNDLGDLLRQLGDAFTGRTNIPVTLTIIGQGTLPTEAQVALYRLCQEGLNNIVKHAKASQVTMKLRYDIDLAELAICDNGQGFDPAQIPSGHYGLNIMQERANAIGAHLLISSQIGQGSEIKFSWKSSPQVEVK
jgi:two-component system nitrate/nitrite sensor histidine kinase NarX